MRSSFASTAATAAVAVLAGGVAEVHGSCTCTWELLQPAGTHWSGTTGANKAVPAKSAELCEQACCVDAGSIGCKAFTFNAGGVQNEECTLYAEVTTSTVWSSGYTAGKLSSSACAKEAEASWTFVVIFLLSVSVYFVGGIVVKQQQGRSTPSDWLPNHQFWASLYGLVIDGVGLVARGGKPAGYAEISAAADAMANEKATSAQNSVSAVGQEVEDPVLSKRQATRSQPTSLHSAATVGDIKKLKRLVKASGSPQIDIGDSRRYTAFHVACAAGHLDCARLLRNAGCDTELTNDVGLTAWELAEQLKRTEIIALQSEPVTTIETSAEPARARRGSNRNASDAAASSDATEHTGHLSGLEESKMLKKELKARGLSVKGSKADLKARLAEAKAADL